MKPLIEIIQTIKELSGVPDNSDVARLLGIKPKTLATAKMRNSIPFDELTSFCNAKGISLNWLLAGEGEMMLKPSINICGPGGRIAAFEVKSLLGHGGPLEDLYSKLIYVFNNGGDDDKERLYGAISLTYLKVLDLNIERDERSGATDNRDKLPAAEKEEESKGQESA